uniref:Serine/threonine-protein kinase 1 n=1 Tax=Erpetoichthys calabaricus TaxID=27687 RepID=A0A8C4S9J5_ERPCA
SAAFSAFKNTPMKIPPEVAFLRSVGDDCPYIIRILDTIVGPIFSFIVMELPDFCMTLFDVIRMHPLAENDAKKVFFQIVKAVLYCHSKQVFHNDIKLENILYQSTTGHIKLIDFGCSIVLSNKTYVIPPGTPLYSPPEWFLFGMYKAEPATVWSLGVLLFEILSGKQPFHSTVEIIECNIIFTSHFSEGKRKNKLNCEIVSKDLIRKCLFFQYGKRLTHRACELVIACVGPFTMKSDTCHVKIQKKKKVHV